MAFIYKYIAQQLRNNWLMYSLNFYNRALNKKINSLIKFFHYQKTEFNYRCFKLYFNYLLYLFIG